MEDVLPGFNGTLRNVNMDIPWTIITDTMEGWLTGECIWDVVLDFQVDKQGGHVQGLVLLVPEADVAVPWRTESRPRSMEQNPPEQQLRLLGGAIL